MPDGNANSVFKKAAPNKEEREKCWTARDAFWKCIKTEYVNSASIPDDVSSAVTTKKCSLERSVYESVCPKSWIVMFDRQHDFKLFRAEKVDEEIKQRAKST